MCVCACTGRVLVPKKVRRGYPISWGWHFRLLGTALCRLVLGTDSGALEEW